MARLIALVLAVSLGVACSAGSGDPPYTTPSNNGGTTSDGSPNDAPSDGSIPDASDDGWVIPDSSIGDTNTEQPINQCATECGPVELCDPSHLGYDDNCNGQVDEICGCVPGLSHWCFKGDPASRNKGACKDGVQQCMEVGMWGACTGGLHADTVDNCLNQGTQTGCHDLSAPPFTPIQLKDGTGSFSAGAASEHFEVACPPSIPPGTCPMVQNPASAGAIFTPLQSGQYSVTYTKTDGGGAQTSCTYALYVGASGLRVELNWDHQGEGAQDHYGGTNTFGPDLDLHVHRPGVQSVWFAGLGMLTDDCHFQNCTAGNFVLPVPGLGTPNWFSDTDYPHNWTYRDPYDPNDPIYTCYNAPRGAGQQWRMFNKGCHNPRLDLDNITCDKNQTDPNHASFCAPENINIDEPPHGLWTRIGVHYFGHCFSGDLHPTVTIYCAGAQVAQFGSSGFNAPVTLAASSCTSDDASGNAFWMVADVMVSAGECGEITCAVQPIYSDINTKTPYIVAASKARSSFGPPCAPGGDAGVGCF